MYSFKGVKAPTERGGAFSARNAKETARSLCSYVDQADTVVCISTLLRIEIFIGTHLGLVVRTPPASKSPTILLKPVAASSPRHSHFRRLELGLIAKWQRAAHCWNFLLQCSSSVASDNTENACVFMRTEVEWRAKVMMGIGCSRIGSEGWGADGCG